MNILLDTHVFLWWSLEPERLPSKLIHIMSSPENSIFLSVASSWESEIKIGLGKLILSEPLQTIINREIQNNDWKILPIHLKHTYQLGKLPPIHRDPFDRILIAQAMSEGLAIATKDSFIQSYKKVKILWD
ncbi:MAG: type II toxin-antitoxin system VapC family toxin [Leptospira sp.]|nr:type II toxin-antitoxin system VapC family toxin [Leptospira sp.]